MSLDLATTRNDEEGWSLAKPIPRPHLFLVLEAHRPIAPPARWRLDHISEVVIGRGDARASALEPTCDGGLALAIRVPDPWMSATHARLRPQAGRWLLTDERSRNRVRRNGVPTHAAELADGDILEIGHTLFVFRESLRARAEEPYELDLAATPPVDPALATVVPSLAEAFRKIAAVAPSEVALLIGGDTGTGKEQIARAAHRLSGRAGPFVAVNCGAIPDSLVESELFGHRAGAFTGAVSHHEGLVRSADRGTLFLDEIGDLPLPAQASLLRVLQERSVVPVGATKPVRVSFRLISATHRDLAHLVQARLFREDLYARLKGFTLSLPPVRDRREDLGLLIGAILRRLSPERAPRLSFHPSVVRAMLDHPFRLNIREIENALATALALNRGEVLSIEDLPDCFHGAPSRPPPSRAPPNALEVQLRDLLARHRGNVTAIAREMNKDRNQIRRWFLRFGLEAETFRR